MSLRDQILNAEDVESEIVAVDGWGGARVEVRSMSTAMREKLSQFAGEGDTESWTAAVVIATCYDPETGEQLFTKDDVAAINSKNGKNVQALADAGLRLSGMTEEAKKEAGKASSSTPDADSSSS